MNERERKLSALLHSRENKIRELEGRIACATGNKPESNDTHYLSGYGQQAAIDAIHDSIKFFQF